MGMARQYSHSAFGLMFDMIIEALVRCEAWHGVLGAVNIWIR